jgi:crotonyl-CoA reductase
MSEIADIRNAILEDAPAEVIGALALPEVARGAIVKSDEQEMFTGLASDDKDPHRSVSVEEFPLPELAPDEAFVAVMASAINFNTVWSSIFEPLPTFGFLKRLGKERASCCVSARRCAIGSPAIG